MAGSVAEGGRAGGQYPDVGSDQRGARSDGSATGAISAARPQLIRAMNERVVIGHIRRSGPLSRTELARLTGLSKPTVSLALSSIERAGLVQEAGRRTGVPGPAAVLYEVRPDAGYVVGLDVGRRYIRGAIMDVAGTVRIRSQVRTKASGARSRIADLQSLSDTLLAEAGIARGQVVQTVVGSPGVYDPRRDALDLAGGLPGWESPTVLARLHEVFGSDLMVENDVDAAAFAEHAHGHGRGMQSFIFVWVGTGIGMGLVIDGKLHRGAHGAAGEIGFLPFTGGHGSDAADARRRGDFEAAASAASVVRAARREGMRAPTSAQKVFDAAAAGDEIAASVVAEEAALIAQAVCAAVAVVDPEIIVLGGGIGQAPGFVDAVGEQVRRLAPLPIDIRGSALGADAVVDGCLAAGLGRAWEKLIAGTSAPSNGAVAAHGNSSR